MVSFIFVTVSWSTCRQEFLGWRSGGVALDSSEDVVVVAVEGAVAKCVAVMPLQVEHGAGVVVGRRVWAWA